MLELLKFEYKRILTCKPLYFLAAAAAIIPLAAGIGLNLFFNLLEIDITGELSSSQEKFFTWFVIAYFYERLPIFLALFTSLFLGRDFKDGFVRNKITAGHSRLSIYASAMITQISVTAALTVIYVLVGTVTMAISPLGANLNNGEMFLRVLVLMLSLIGMTVLFTALSMAINNRALVTVLSVVFVMGLGIMNTAATSYSYSEKMVDEYIEACEDAIDDMDDMDSDLGYSFAQYYNYDVPDKKDYINYGWYICHPIYVLTNAGIEGDLMPTLQNSVLVSSDEMFSYPKKVSHAGFTSSIMTYLFSESNPPPLTDKQIKKIDGMIVDVDDLLVAYTVKSLVWIAIFSAGGYAIFRKKNLS